jgi:hypothetical protein
MRRVFTKKIEMFLLDFEKIYFTRHREKYGTGHKNLEKISAFRAFGVESAHRI